MRGASTAQSTRLLLSSDLLRVPRLASAEVAACSCRCWLISLAAWQVRTPYMLVQQHDYVLQRPFDARNLLRTMASNI